MAAHLQLHLAERKARAGGALGPRVVGA